MLTPIIKNLVFDLGGVILDLSVEDTLKSFSVAANLPVDIVQDRFRNSEGFDLYEKGLMTDQQFRDFVRDLYGVSISDEELDKCWNAMLVNIPKAKLELLSKLKDTFNVYLLSNTNNIHLSYINDVLMKQHGHHDLDYYFHKAFYSHRMLKRKPEPEIFQQVLEENFLIAEQTLFLDDNLANVKAAELLGIRIVHVTSPQLILDYFHE